MISQKKIAEALNMPVSTVANILNGTPFYKKETRERVLKAAADLGYQRNRASVAIRRGRSNLIGVIQFGSSYETAHMCGYHLAQAIGAHGYDYLAVDLKWHAGNARRALNEIIQTRAEGAILLGNTAELFTKECLATLERYKIPVVSLYGEEHLSIPLVGDNSTLSFHSMVRHLQGVGHRSILHPSINASAQSTSGRRFGVQSALEGRGPYFTLAEEEFIKAWPRLYREHRNQEFGVTVDIDLTKGDGDLIDAHTQFAKRLFASGALPDAIVCTNDRAACGFINAAFEMKVRVPEDIAVTGADNDRIGNFPMFRLTTIQMDIEQSSKEAVNLLLKRMKGKQIELSTKAFPAQLVLRQSCGRMAASREEQTMFKLTGEG